MTSPFEHKIRIFAPHIDRENVLYLLNLKHFLTIHTFIQVELGAHFPPSRIDDDIEDKGGKFLSIKQCEFLSPLIPGRRIAGIHGQEWHSGGITHEVTVVLCHQPD